MQKIKTYFRVLFASLNPIKAKKYFLGFSIWQTLGFLLITITLIWVLFLYISTSIVSYKIQHSAMLKEKTSEVITKISTGVYSVFKQIPFNSILIDPGNKQIKVLGLQQPYTINFYIDYNCSLNDWQNPQIKKGHNNLLVFCPKNSPISNKPMADILNSQPELAIFINTNTPAVALDAVLNRTPGFADIIITSEYLDMGVQEGVSSSATYKTERVYFKDILTKDDVPSFKFIISKDEILKWGAAFIKKIPNLVNIAYSKYIPQVTSALFRVFTPLLAFGFILFSFIPTKSFVLFFNVIGSILLGAFVGFIISQFKPFNKTSKGFKQNFIIASLATTTLFLYRFILSIILGGILLLSDNKIFLIGLKIILLNNWLYVFVLILVMLLLKINAKKQIKIALEMSN